MSLVGKSRVASELRKKPRRQFHYRAQILTSENGPPHACAIVDISQSGARIALESSEDLPRRFVLLLSAQGSAQRVCRLVWQRGLSAGVEFPDSRD
jgi:hypothetical protein